MCRSCLYGNQENGQIKIESALQKIKIHKGEGDYVKPKRYKQVTEFK